MAPNVIVEVKSFFPSDKVTVFNPALYFFAQAIPASLVDPPMMYIIENISVPLTETLSLTEGKS